LKTVYPPQKLAQKLSSFEQYVSSQDYIDIAERNIQVAIESCLDIGKILITENDLQEPADNKGVFIILAEAGIISKESLSFLIPSA